MNSQKIYRDSIQGLRKPNILRLVEKASLTDDGNLHPFFLKKGHQEEDNKNDNKDKNIRVSSLIPEEIRIIVKNNLDILLGDIIRYIELNNKKIIKEDDIYPFLSYIPADIPNLKLCDSKSKNMKDCFYFPEKSFKKLIKEVAQDYKDGLKFSKEALQIIQYEIEKALYEQVKYGVLEAIHAKRHTLFPKDLQLSKRITSRSKQPNYSYNDIDEIFSFEDFYPKILKYTKNNNKKLKMDEKYSEQLDFFLNMMLHKLLKIALKVKKVSKNNKVTLKEVRYAIYDLFPGELAKHAISEGNKILEIKDKNKLIVDKDVIEEFVEDYYDNIDIEDNVILFLTTVVEYIITEILYLSLSVSKTSFDSNTLYRVIKNDEELNELRERLKIVIVNY